MLHVERMRQREFLKNTLVLNILRSDKKRFWIGSSDLFCYHNPVLVIPEICFMAGFLHKCRLLQAQGGHVPWRYREPDHTDSHSAEEVKEFGNEDRSDPVLPLVLADTGSQDTSFVGSPWTSDPIT